MYYQERRRKRLRIRKRNQFVRFLKARLHDTTGVINELLASAALLLFLFIGVPIFLHLFSGV